MSKNNLLGLQEGIAELKKELKKKQLIAFVGSGMSIREPSNLPNWDTFIQQFIEYCSDLSELLEDPYKSEFSAVINDARNIKGNDPTKVASVLKDKLSEIDKDNLVTINIESHLKRWFIEKFSTVEYNSNHENIVNIEFPYILTSNYDMLLEKALERTDHKRLAYSTYTFTEADKIASSLFSKSFSIIHIHGKYEDIVVDNIVFTSEDYTKMLRRQFPGFTMTIQNLLTNFSTIFLGYGGSDPHLEDILEEHSYYLNYSKINSLPRNYMVVLRKNANKIFSEYKFKRRTSLIAIDTYDEYDTLLQELRSAYPREKTLF
ncbi:MAG: SIR2 family protein [Bacteroidota bacterium]